VAITPDGPVTDIKPDGPISEAPPSPQPQAIQPDGPVSAIKPDGPVSDSPVPDSHVTAMAPNPIHTPHAFDAQINEVSKKTGINPRIMQAIGMQESGLGQGGNYNAATGRDRDSNQGVSPWQLDPASGISKDKLDRAAKDPAYAAELSANMMRQNMEATGGNLREALSMYNSGSRTSKVGLAYADSVLHFMGNDDAILGSPSLMEKVKHDAKTIGHAIASGQPITAKTMGHLQTTKPLHDLEVRGLQAWEEIRHHPLDATMNVLGALQRGVGGTLYEAAEIDKTPDRPAPEMIRQYQEGLHHVWDMVFNPTEKNEAQSTSGFGDAVNQAASDLAGHKVNAIPTHAQIDNFVRKTLHTPKIMQPYVEGFLKTGEDIGEQVIEGGHPRIGTGLMHLGLHAPAVVARAAHGVAQSMGIAKYFPHLPLLAQAHTALADAFVARRDLDRAGLTEAGKKVRLSVENKHLNLNPGDVHAATRNANKEFTQLVRMNPELHRLIGPSKIKDAALKGLGVQDNSDLFRALRGVEAKNPLVELGKLGKKAILWNPIPHGLVNVGTLTYQAGGLPAVMSGFKYMIAHDPAVEARLGEMGGMQDYADPTNNKFLKASNALLHRMEVGWRSGLLEQLDKKLGVSAPGSVEEYLKGHLISSRVGDYRNQSAFVKTFQALGGPFVAFGLGIVPQQFLKTLEENPARITRLLQAQEDIQANRQGRKKNTLVFNNPVTDAIKLFTDPIHYITSPSRTGGLAELFDLKEEEDDTKYKGLGEIGIDLATAFIPGLEDLTKAGGALLGENMPGQKMSLADRLADSIEETFLNMFYQKPEKPSIVRAQHKKISKEVGF
jgi:hypothetical protein